MRRRAWAHSPRAANHPKIVTIRALYRDPMPLRYSLLSACASDQRVISGSTLAQCGQRLVLTGRCRCYKMTMHFSTAASLSLRTPYFGLDLSFCSGPLSFSAPYSGPSSEHGRSYHYSPSNNARITLLT